MTVRPLGRNARKPTEGNTVVENVDLFHRAHIEQKALQMNGLLLDVRIIGRTVNVRHQEPTAPLRDRFLAKATHTFRRKHLWGAPAHGRTPVGSEPSHGDLSLAESDER